MTKKSVKKRVCVHMYVRVRGVCMCDFYYYDRNSTLTSERTIARFLHDCLLQREDMKVDKKWQISSEGGRVLNE